MKNLRTDYGTLMGWATTTVLAALICAPAISAQPARRGMAPRAAARPVPERPAVDPAVLAVPEIDIDRDGDALRDEIRPRPADTDIADTALVFTSHVAKVVDVKCVARDQSGSVVGRIRTRLPAHGLRYLRASDFSDGRDFVGHAKCKSNGHVTATGMLFGAEITDLPSKSRRRGRGMQHEFALIATY